MGFGTVLRQVEDGRADCVSGPDSSHGMMALSGIAVAIWKNVRPGIAAAWADVVDVGPCATGLPAEISVLAFRFVTRGLLLD